MLYKKQSFTYFCKVKKASKYNLSMVVFLTIIPIIGIVGTSFYVYYNGIELFEPILLISLWFFTGMGITMGYHRYYSHRAFKMPKWIEYYLLFFAHIMMVGPAITWVANHREHHKYVDTPKDPHSPHYRGWLMAYAGQVLSLIHI